MVCECEMWGPRESTCQSICGSPLKGHTLERTLLQKGQKSLAVNSVNACLLVLPLIKAHKD